MCVTLCRVILIKIQKPWPKRRRLWVVVIDPQIEMNKQESWSDIWLEERGKILPDPWQALLSRCLRSILNLIKLHLIAAFGLDHVTFNI